LSVIGEEVTDGLDVGLVATGVYLSSKLIKEITAYVDGNVIFSIFKIQRPEFKISAISANMIDDWPQKESEYIYCTSIEFQRFSRVIEIFFEFIS